MNEYVEKLKKDLSIDESFDITYRVVENNTGQFHLFFLNFLISPEAIRNIIFSLNNYDVKLGINHLAEVILNEASSVVYDYDLIYENILNGNVAIFLNDEKCAILSEVRMYPSRSISEPDAEKVVRGARDGFCENIAFNIGLIRRRIKTGNLKVLKYTIGSVSKTYVSVVYLEEYVNKKYLKEALNRLEKIKVKELTMADKALEELIVDNKISPYPLVKYTERPDTLSSHLYQGMFGILVDTSPCAMIAPCSIFDQMQHAEEFTQSFVSGSYLRIIRLLGIILSFLAVPVWFALLKYDMFHLSYFGKIFDVDMNFSAIFVQLIILELGIEFIRMASIHTPSALSTSMGLIAGVIVGEMAINMEILSEQVVLLGAISAIGSYITPSYELSLANKITKLIIVVVVYLFGIVGLIVSLVLLIVYLSLLKSFNRPYLYPLIPFNFNDFKNQILRKRKKSNR